MKWIGMVHVKPLPGSTVLGDNVKGAYGNVVAIADNELEYHEAVLQELLSDGLSVMEFSEVAPEHTYLAEGKMSEYLEFLLEKLSSHREVAFHTFYNYLDDDA